MIGLIQRVNSASVLVDKRTISQIDKGILLLLGVEKNDTQSKAEALAQKISKMRIFSDENDKMNLSIQDIKGEILVVSQFTLVADVKKGNRPGFSDAAPPELGQSLYLHFVEYYQNQIGRCQKGQFGANMQVCLENDGPATFYIKI